MPHRRKLPPGRWTHERKGNIRHVRRVRAVSTRSEIAADQAIATCGGDDLEAMKALLVAVDFLEAPGRRPPGGGSDRLARPRYDVQRDRDPEVRRRTRGPGAL